MAIRGRTNKPPASQEGPTGWGLAWPGLLAGYEGLPAGGLASPSWPSVGVGGARGTEGGCRLRSRKRLSRPRGVTDPGASGRLRVRPPGGGRAVRSYGGLPTGSPYGARPVRRVGRCPVFGNSPVVAVPSQRVAGSRVCPKGRPKGALDAGGSVKTLMRRGRAVQGEWPAGGDAVRSCAAPLLFVIVLVVDTDWFRPDRGLSGPWRSADQGGNGPRCCLRPQSRSPAPGGEGPCHRPAVPGAGRRRARRAEGVAGRSRPRQDTGNGPGMDER